jgi:phage-related protein
LTVDEVGRVTEAATVVAQNSALTFTDFGTAVQYAGATFKAAGFQIEDLAVGEALLGKNGVTGSVAATSLRGVIQRLIRPSKDAAEIMQQYGIHLFDAAGKSVGFDAVLQQLNHAFSDQAIAEGRITEEQRLHAISTLGLQRTGAAFLILANATSSQLDDLRASFQRLNIQQLVEKQLDTFNSQVKIADNNIRALALVFGQQFIPALTDGAKVVVKFLQGISTDQAAAFGQAVLHAGQAVIDFATNVVRGIGDIIKAFGLGDAAAQLLKTTIIGLAVVITANLVAGILASVAAWAAFVLAVGIATTAVANIANWVQKLGYQFAGWVQQFGPVGDALSHIAIAASDAFGALGALLTGDFDRAVSLANQSFYEFSYSLRTDGGAALAAIQKSLQDAGAALAPWAAQAGVAGDAVSSALSGVSGVVQALEFLLQGNLPAAALVAQGALRNFGQAFSDVGTLIQSTIQPPLQWLTQVAFPLIESTAQSLVASLTNAFNSLKIGDDLTNIWKNIQTIFQTLGPIVGNLASAFGSLADIVSRAIGGFGQAQSSSALLDAAMTALLLPIKALVAGWLLLSDALAIAFGLLSQGTAKFAAIAASADAAAPSVSGFATIFQTAATVVQNAFTTMQTTVTNVLQTVVGIIMQLPASIQGALASVEQSISDTWAQVQAVTTAIWSAIPPEVQGPLTQVVSDITSIWGMVPDLVGAILQNMEQIAIGIWNDLVTTETAVLNALVATVSAIIQLQVDTVINILNTLKDLVQGPLGQFEAAVLGALANMVGTVEKAALGIAAAMVSGFVAGILNGASAVTGAVRGLMQSAIDAARAQVGAHSPATEFIAIGEDVTAGVTEGVDEGIPDVESAGQDTGVALATGIIDALDQMKAPVRASAANLVDQALSAFEDISGRASQLLSDTEAKMTDVGETVGRNINKAIQDASDKIAQTIQDANDRIQELQDNLSQSRSDRGRRSTLQQSQDQRRQARRNAEEDADATASHQQDLADAAFNHQQDIDKAQAKAQEDLGQAKTDKERQTIQNRLADELAAADVSYKQEQDSIDRKFQADEAARQATRQRQQEDADFERQLDAETQALNDQLEDEALARSIDRANKERDARIDAINKALSDKEKAIEEQAAREIVSLQQNVSRRLAILEDEFAKKAAELLRKGGENMRPLVENIQQILSENFGEMKSAAEGFANSVGNAINALKALEAERAHAKFDQAPNVPSPTQGIGDVPDVSPEIDTTPLPEFAHGGMVPGPRGRALLAIVHGGEFIASMDSVAARWAQQMTNAQPAGNSYSYQYTINPRYESVQSPASVDMDLKALLAMTR